MKLTVCIITKNEEKKLRSCLEHIKPYGFEIVVVDTGSTDGTKSMVKQYTSQLYDYKWSDDFSAAKNYAAGKASNDIILTLDSDEYIIDWNIKEAEALLNNNSHKVGRIYRKNIVSDENEDRKFDEYISRVYDRRIYRYRGRIHEQLVRIDGREETEMYELPIILEHDGYKGKREDKKAKAERNIRLLLMDLEENPEDVYILYQLGKGYYMAGDYKKSAEYFDRALGYDVDPKLEYVVDMVETYGYALVNSGQAQKALGLEGVYDVFGNCADFKFMMGIVYMNNQLYDAAVAQFIAATNYKSARAEGANSFLAYYNAGVICECLGNIGQAVKYYSMCGEYERAKARLIYLQKKE